MIMRKFLINLHNFSASNIRYYYSNNTHPLLPSSWLIQAVKENPLEEITGKLAVVMLMEPSWNRIASVSLPGLP